MNPGCPQKRPSNNTRTSGLSYISCLSSELYCLQISLKTVPEKCSFLKGSEINNTNLLIMGGGIYVQSGQAASEICPLLSLATLL